MSGDLEDFLRRAAALRRSQNPPPSQQTPPRSGQPPKAGQKAGQSPKAGQPARSGPPPKVGQQAKSGKASRGSQARPQQPSRAAQQARRSPPDNREILQAEILDDAPPVHNVTGDDIAAQVHQNLSTRGFAARISQLGEKTGQADERMHEHLHQVFDHQLGRLSAPTQAVSGGITAALGPNDPSPPIDMPLLFNLLRSADGLRNMILVSEILNRPVHRW